ncbi:very short patch repair endonuclease [Paenibacillus sp. GP183]|uniref:very short patch repair endonuclease n=1 Tax=Paenibacillus sp. GP183 TaxID=1882751 RepID=UPI000895BC3C|nr:very short patch repair endonuclease [Paenibacillus sp. GP183]SED07104.1 T/G mismatch-specific endonuclease [Paenibacillus sp. GP183]
MTDNLSSEERRKNMSAIRSTHSKLENRISRALWQRGFRFRRNVKNLLGKPDIAIKKYKIVIFVDSCYWHGCEIHGSLPKSNEDYWITKLERNKQRDLKVTHYYLSMGWSILRLWEHQFKKDCFEQTMDQLCSFISQSKDMKKDRT